MQAEIYGNMKLIPIYAWNKGIVTFEHKNKSFTKKPWSQGVLLFACVIVAMLLANLPFTKDLYHGALETEIGFHFRLPGGDSVAFPAGMTVEKFINDILMVLFFFCVGLEIKREVAFGELCTFRKAILPVIAAVGGVVVPALIFTIVNHGKPTAGGWGIPTATDIAFAVGILSVLGDKVPVSLKVFLTALAIADDLIAILVVALFYGGSLNLGLLAIAAVLIAAILIMNKLGEKRNIFYLIPALAIWVLFYYSGIHATMSGVVMAFLVPMTPRYSREYFMHKRERYLSRMLEYDSVEEGGGFPNGPQRHCLRRLGEIAGGSIGLSYRLENALSPWVNFVIMPIFALANAGVEITDASYFNIFSYSPELGSVSMGIFLGLVLGKPIGITLASFAAIKSGLGSMPENASWKMLLAVACLGGIGFTMSIFVDTLSFGSLDPATTEALRNMGKVAVLAGSLCAGVLGTIMVNIVSATERKR